MVDNTVWLTTGPGRGLSPDMHTPTHEPSHIHVPRPSRVAPPADADDTRAPARALDDVQPAGTRS